MTVSAMYHTYNSLSLSTEKKCLRLDMIGIGIEILTLTVVSVYSGFYAHPDAGLGVVLVMVALTLCNIAA